MTDIGQGGMVDDWGQSAPGKIDAPPTWRWESGGGGGVRLSFWYYHSYITYTPAAVSLEYKLSTDILLYVLYPSYLSLHKITPKLFTK